MPSDPRASSELRALSTITAISPPMLSTSKSCVCAQQFVQVHVCAYVPACWCCVRLCLRPRSYDIQSGIHKRLHS
eukprot:scaffold183608_cov18-Tisochrysis_lutea.AAC.1